MPRSDWRRTVTGGRTLEECVFDNRPKREVVHVAINKREYSKVAEAMRKRGMGQTEFLRMCIGEWLVNHTDIIPEYFPQLMKDVPRDR